MSQQKTSVTAIIGLVLAIIGLLLSAVPIVNNFAFVLALIGLVLGLIGLRKVKKGTRGGKKVALVAVILSVVAGGIVLLSQQFYGKVLDEASSSMEESANKMSGGSTEELLRTDVDVKLGTFSATADQYGMTTTVLPVTVKNKNAAAKSYGIHIEAVDQSGARLADDTVNVNTLGSGQTQQFQAFQFVDSGKVEALKTAQFKIHQVSQY